MKNPEKLARNITEMVANDSFKFFQTKDFVEMSNLKSFEQTEQDRIFNEIVVSGLALAILMFETLGKITEDERLKQYYMESKTETESRYGNWLKELGSEPEFADSWKPLIRMRTDQYQKDYKKYKKEFDDRAKKNPWIFIVAIGGYDHITRGKGKPKDPLFLHFLHWTHQTAEKITNFIV